MKRPFLAGGKRYELHLTPEDDCTRIYGEGSDKVMFKVDSSANVYNANHKKVGRFTMDGKECWYFTDGDRLAALYGYRDLIRTEMQFFKDVLEMRFKLEEGQPNV
jgi:hypothetical protein